MATLGNRRILQLFFAIRQHAILPLQKQPREHGCSLFVNEAFVPYPDQWGFLASIRPMPRFELESAILRATGGRHPLDVAFVSEEDEREPSH